MTQSVIKKFRAEEDLIDIWCRIAAHDEAAADRVLKRIEARWQILAEHSLAGPVRDDIAPGIRHLVMDEYLIFYRVVDEEVEILRVLHGRRHITGSDMGA